MEALTTLIQNPFAFTVVCILALGVLALLFFIIYVIYKKGMTFKNLKVGGPDTNDTKKSQHDGQTAISTPDSERREYKRRSDDHDKVVIKIATLKSLVDICDNIYEEFIRRKEDVQKLLTASHVASLSRCLEETVNSICLEALNMDKPLLKANSIENSEGQHMLQLYLAKDFNELLSKELKLIEESQQFNKVNEESFNGITSGIVQRLSGSMQLKLSSYPTFFDKDLVKVIFHSQQTSIRNSINILVQEFVHADILKKKKIEELMDAKDKELNEKIQQLIST